MSKKKKINNTQMKEIISEETENVSLNFKSNTVNNTKIEDSTLIRVKSNVFGKLIYRNARSGEETIWEKCGEIQIMSMGDLRAMKANQASFFVNQWVVILGVDEGSDCEAKAEDIYRALTISKYYGNLVESSDYEEICSWDEEEIEEKISTLSEDAKRNLAIALNEFIKAGVLDSGKKIKAFEKALNCELSDIE